MKFPHSGSRHLLAGLTLAAGAIGLAHAGGMHSHAGEALDIERPSMRMPVVADPAPHVVLVPVGDVVLIKDDVVTTGPLSRDQVRAEFAEARAAGALPHQGEIADTPQVLAAREDVWDQDVEQVVAVVTPDSVSVAELGPSVLIDTN